MRSSDFEKAGISLIEFYRNNPVLAAEDLLGVSLDIVQGVILEDMWFRPYTIVTAGRGCGKSFLLSVISTLKCLLYPGERVGIISSSFRQAKNTFLEVRRRWEEAPILREATVKRPTFGADRCYLEFRSVKDKQASIIEALPIGDGSKIRGSRFYTILLDEYAFIPSDIVDTVVTPMAATSSNPMERVKLIKRLKELEAQGVKDTSFLGLQDSVNKLIGVTSAYFTFNHVYERISMFREKIREGSKDYSVHFISYRDMSEGFIEINNVMLAKNSMPEILFSMEYEGVWKADTDGVFKASLIEASKEGSAGIRLVASKSKQYIMGVDPARSSDAFAICIIELGDPANLVYAFKSKDNKFPEMADVIFTLADKFNVSAIMLDAGAGGGGLALKDMLADRTKYGSNVILDMDDPEYIEAEGRKILKMFNPSPKTNAAAVFGSVTLLEQGKLKLPRPPTRGDDAEDIVYETLEELYKQLISIVITETRSGLAHFDVAGGGGHGGAKKDLYSAFILVSALLYEQVYSIQEEVSIHSVGGILIPRDRATMSLGRRNKYYGY